MIDPNQLQQIIQGGETFTVEFKGEERSPLPDHELVEAAVCLANGQGGVLLVGVEDDGQVTGARPRHGLASDPLRVQSLIQGRTVPALTTRVHLQDYQGQSLEAMAQLERLMQFGWLEARGRGEKRRYRLAGPAREALREGTSRPVRASAEELEQREALILDHVCAHGQITRSEVASMCQVSSDQARHLLRRLVQQRQLIARGRGRGTYYELPPK